MMLSTPQTISSDSELDKQEDAAWDSGGCKKKLEV